MWTIIGWVLLVINVAIGYDDIKKGHTIWRSALTWFVVGWLAFDLIMP